jgi:hypothetical protein
MAINTSVFAQSVFANITKIEQDINRKCYQISRELFLSIVSKTPSPSNPGRYAKGELVNNWFPVDGPNFSSETTDARSATGAESIARINNDIGAAGQFLRQDGTVTLSNNLDYAFRAEYRGWPEKDNARWRNAQPYRMVAQSLMLISAKYK